eukprot:9846353-Karenia_brevis.AAC.1
MAKHQHEHTIADCSFRASIAGPSERNSSSGMAQHNKSVTQHRQEHAYSISIAELHHGITSVQHGHKML